MTTVTETKKIIASESGHWYDGKTGEPRYTIIGANGKERNTTLRDARKFGYVPSVTSVLQILAKPGLDAWKMNNLLLAAATMPHDENMPVDVWCDKVVQDAREQSENAMQLGTDIHGAIEYYLITMSDGVGHQEYVHPVVHEMNERTMLNFINTEKSFAHPIGFGGKIDFYNDEYLIDFKTKAFTRQDVEDKKQLAWSEHVYQLGAYRYGIGKPHLKCMNIFISTTEPGLFVFHEWTEEEVKNGCNVFLKTLELWKLIKGV